MTLPLRRRQREKWVAGPGVRGCCNLPAATLLQGLDSLLYSRTWTTRWAASARLAYGRKILSATTGIYFSRPQSASLISTKRFLTSGGLTVRLSSERYEVHSYYIVKISCIYITVKIFYDLGNISWYIFQLNVKQKLCKTFFFYRKFIYDAVWKQNSPFY